MFLLMKKLLFLLMISCCLASCKSVGVHVQGRSTILRNDTIRTSYEVSKPIDKVVHLDY